MDQDKSQQPESQHQPQQFHEAIEGPNNSNDPGQTQDTTANKPRFSRSWTALNPFQILFDLLLVIVTSVYTYYSSQQWDVLRDTLTETRKLAKAAQEANELTRETQRQAMDIVADTDRPWVGVNHINLVDYALGKRMGVKLKILNSGKTPALTIIAKIYVGVATGFPLEPPNKTFPIPYEVQATLFPNQTMDLPAILDKMLSTEEFNNLTSGIFSFIVWGTLMYTDRFQRPHTTTICGVFNTKVNPSAVSFCATGNAAQ